METQILKTSSPFEELSNYAKNNRLDLDELDFKILSYKTTAKINNNIKTFEQSELDFFDDDDNFRDCEEISQIYEILITKKIMPLIEFKISTNKAITKLVASFNTTNYDFFNDLETVQENIIDLINKRFIKQNFLLGIRQFDLDERLTNMLKSFYTRQSSEAKILLARGLDAINTIDSKTIFHYKEKKMFSDDKKKIDYSQRGFITAVGKGELLMEFVKPIEGKRGRNLKGQTIEISRMNLKYAPDFKISKNITQEDNGQSIRYYSNDNGYIAFSSNNNEYDVKNSVNVKVADFKATGSIVAGLNKDVTLNVEEEDKLKDAIGANLSIEVSELNVRGNVAQNSTIRAKEVNIGGQTHAKSKIYSEYINIAAHKGYCEGKIVKIDRLEGGVVIGKNVHVKQAIGGKIVATTVKIDTLTTNTIIEVSDTVIIGDCLGENNKILLSVSKSSLIIDSLEKTLKGLNDCDKILQTLPKNIENKKFIIESNKDSIVQIREKIQEMKIANITPPSAFITKIKDYQKAVSEYNELSIEYKDTIERQEYLKDNLKMLENKIYDAKVINLGKWGNLNEVRFKLLHPELEVAYNTKENEKIYCLKLEKTVLNGKETPQIVKLDKSGIKDFDSIEIIENGGK